MTTGMTAMMVGGRTERTTWAVGGLGIAAGLSLVKLAIHLATTGTFGYEYFIDELYFLDCAKHLDWGYVDLPPLFPALTAAWIGVFGESLLAIRIVPALAGAALVLLTGLLVRELGGGRLAQALAALGVVFAPIYLVMSSLHTMNALEPLFWMGAALVLVKLIKGADPRLWLVFGLLSGLGLLNKHSMALFGASVVVGLVLTRERRVFRERWIWLGAAVALLVFLPNLVWLVQHRFPHLEMLANIERNGRNVALSPLAFLGQQVLFLNPIALPLWLGGLGYLLFHREGRRFRVLGLTYLGVLGLLLLLHGRVYYLAPAYAMLFAAGGVAFERWFATRTLVPAAYAFLIVLSGAVLAPLMLPCLPPETFIRYTRLIGLEQPRIETHRLGPLPQLHADRFGWKEMADEVARVYRSLPAAGRSKVAIFGQNYGQAGAINHYGPALGLPPALSGHLTHWYWGPRDYTGEVMIVLDDSRETLETLFESVELAGHVTHRYSMPYERFDIHVCRRPKAGSLRDLWPRVKEWD